MLHSCWQRCEVGCRNSWQQLVQPPEGTGPRSRWQKQRQDLQRILQTAHCAVKGQH